MLQAINSRTGIPTKLTRAPGPMLTVTLIIMLYLCKIFFYLLLSLFLLSVMFCLLVYCEPELPKKVCAFDKLISVFGKSFCSELFLVLLFICRSLPNMGFSGILSPKIGALKTLKVL